MMRWKSILLFVVVFGLGIVAGFGIGNIYGANSYNAQLEQKVTDLQSRFQTVNDNYLTLVREYNKLFTLKAPAAASPVAAVATSAAPAAASPVAAVATSAAPTAKPAATTATADVKATPPPAAKATAAPTTAATAKPAATTATTKATVAPTNSAPAGGAKAKAEFKALAIGGTGPLEGAPPLLVQFTDLSTGTIASWKWDFGDGETSTEQNPEHKYMDCPGDKKLCTVKLTVCGPDGACVTASKPDYLWVSEACTGC
jgi:hypothetical protein